MIATVTLRLPLSQVVVDSSFFVRGLYFMLAVAFHSRRLRVLFPLRIPVLS